MEELVLQRGEHIVLAVRKHWLVYVGGFIPYLVLAWIPDLAISWLTQASSAPWAAAFTYDNPWVRFIVGVYWLFVWMAAMSDFMRYYLDIWIITNKRIIDVEQEDFFHREVSSLFLDHVEDVEVMQRGFFHTLFGFGTIFVQSAGAAEKTMMPGVPDPKHIRDTLMHQILEFEQKKEK